MNIVHSRKVKPAAASTKVQNLLETITEAQLRQWVEHISAPRHFAAEPKQNRATANWLHGVFESLGYRVERQGKFANILALPDTAYEEVVLVGAHYDSVPMSPGADDNGSAVAAMLGCATACSRWQPELSVIFVAFNREEDGLLGSRDFVESYLPDARFYIRCAHILEMVGYARSAPGSQRVPGGLSIKISNKGDFLGLLANGCSMEFMDSVLRNAATYVPKLPVTGLKVRLGLEAHLPVLTRSDHAPFWDREIPAVMWTDTAEFRNPNYHSGTDTPDTLDYQFLRKVTQLLTANVISEATSRLDVSRRGLNVLKHG
jgi:Zn-dependent M28 family amino/carboxypeptidase